MSDMYEKLAELLNNVLETGEIPQDEITKDQNPVNYKDNGENSDPFSFNPSNSSENQLNNQKRQKKSENINIFQQKIREKYTSGDEIPTGSVIKEADYHCINMHKYTKLMHIPCIVSKSLDTLHIASIENLTSEQLRKQYHQLLKENHPDTANKKGILTTPEELKNAFDIVNKYLF